MPHLTNGETEVQKDVIYPRLHKKPGAGSTLSHLLLSQRWGPDTPVETGVRSPVTRFLARRAL